MNAGSFAEPQRRTKLVLPIVVGGADIHSSGGAWLSRLS